MTTNSISNNINRLQQAGFQPDNKKAAQPKSAGNKDVVEISAKGKQVTGQNATYSKDSVQKVNVPAGFNVESESVHNLEDIKDKISRGFYDTDQVTDVVVNRIIDQLE